MKTKIKTWGNSLGLRLPKNLVDDLHLRDGSEVEITNNKGNIIISPKEKTSFTLSELLEGMQEQGVMEQYLPKSPIGKEAFWNDEQA